MRTPLPFILVAPSIFIAVACSTEPEPSSPLQPLELTWRIGDTVVVEYTQYPEMKVDLDTHVVTAVAMEDGNTVTHWLNTESDIGYAEWIDAGLLKRSLDLDYLGIFGKLPTFRGEIIYSDSSLASMGHPEEGWRVSRFTTITADTTLVTKAGTYRCAGFSFTIRVRDTVYDESRYWYAPGYGLVQNEDYSTDSMGAHLDIARRSVRIKNLLAK